MKIIKLFLLIGFVSAFLFAYSNGKEKVNYKVTKVMKLEQSFIKKGSFKLNSYQIQCPGGGVGCGSALSLLCVGGGSPCPPPDSPPYRVYTCPNVPGGTACIYGFGPNPVCTTPSSCPPPM